MTDYAQEIQITLDEANEKIDAGESLLRLRRNKDFKRLIEKGYLNDEALRLVAARANPNLTEQQRESLVTQIDGIAHFQNFMNLILQEAHYFEDVKREYENSLSVDDDEVA